MPEWQNAVLGNTGSGGTVDANVNSSYAAWAAANSVTDANIGNFLGSWGVDLADDEVWAVLNHNSQFAVVPEPAAIVLAFCGLLSLWGAGKRIPKPVRSYARQWTWPHTLQASNRHWMDESSQ